MIETLTDEQVAHFPNIVSKWVKLGLATDKFTLEEATRIINNLTKYILKSENKPIFVFNSPIQCWAFISLRESGYKRELTVDNVMEKIKGVKMIDFVFPYLSGSFDSAFFSWIDVVQFIGATNLPENIEYYTETHKLGLIFPMDDYTVVSQKPNLIKKNANGLHCENGPALTYDDGGLSDIYSLNGIRMSKEYVMIPAEKMDANLVLSEKNADIRRELLRKIGIERFLQVSKHKVLDIKGNYELLSVDLDENVKDAKFLKMVNPSIGVYHVEGVAPECLTVDHAINWRSHNDINKVWDPQILT